MNYRVCFTAELRRQGRCAATIRRHSLAVSEFYAYLNRLRIHKSVPQGLQFRYLEAYKTDLLTARQLRPSTVNQRLAGLSAFARFLLARGRLTHNPLELVPRVNRDGISPLPILPCWDDVQKLRQAVNQNVLDLSGRLIVEFLYTGMTVREICSLQYAQRDNSFGRKPVLQDSLKPSSRAEGTRKVQLHPEGRLALEHYLILRPILMGDRLLVGKGQGWALMPGTVYNVLRRLSRQIGVRVGVRQLRLAQFAHNIHIQQMAA